MADVTGELPSWNEVAQKADWDGLLLGNGASVAVWPTFSYGSLFQMATSGHISNPLTDADAQLFDHLESVNFEQVLGALALSKRVNESFQIGTSEVETAYERVKTALIESIHYVHIPWNRISQSSLLAIRNTLKGYSVVFSLNYDLLAYWAVMAEQPFKDFKDYFWTGTFDIANTEVWGKSTRMLWVHGGLHLYRDLWGQTFKQTAEGPGANLLERFGSGTDITPLFVTEGSHQDKLQSIMRSDYLSFAFHELAEHDGPLVVFGCSLDDEDKHIVDAINRRQRTIAFSLAPGDEESVRAKKALILSRLSRPEVFFFDASTHGLGDPGLRIAP